jgi:uncharacterized membrane protein YhaH (DUF805 family)
MSPIDWALRPLKKYATFSGRAPRAEFWWFMLALFVVYMIVWIGFGATLTGLAATGTDPSAGLLGAFGAAGIAMVLFWLVLLIPTIAVQVRRLHDTERSGWWLGVFYLLYAVYMALTMGSAFSAVATGDPSQVATGGFIGAMVLGLVLFVYMIVLLVFYCLPGTKGPNKYGEDPYGGNLGEVFA